MVGVIGVSWCSPGSFGLFGWGEYRWNGGGKDNAARTAREAAAAASGGAICCCGRPPSVAPLPRTWERLRQRPQQRLAIDGVLLHLRESERGLEYVMTRSLHRCLRSHCCCEVLAVLYSLCSASNDARKRYVSRIAAQTWICPIRGRRRARCSAASALDARHRASDAQRCTLGTLAAWRSFPRPAQFTMAVKMNTDVNPFGVKAAAHAAQRGGTQICRQQQSGARRAQSRLLHHRHSAYVNESAPHCSRALQSFSATLMYGVCCLNPFEF